MYFYTTCRQLISPANDGDARIQHSAKALPELERNRVVGDIGASVLGTVVIHSKLSTVIEFQASPQPRPGAEGFGLAAKT